MITIKQLAALAGVSPSTIVNVLHGRSYKVTEETLKRVQTVIKETGYVPNMGGRLLKNRNSRLIGVIITWARRNEENIVQDPFFSEIIGALEHEIRARGYFMMLYTSENAVEGIQMAKSWLVEGLIVLGSLAGDCSIFIRGINIPLVFIDGYFYDDGLPYVNVGLEDRQGAFLMTEYLFRKGHRHIAFLNEGKPVGGSGLERFYGYQDALRYFKLPVFGESYIPLSYKNTERHEFLLNFAQGDMKKYTALFFFSDFYAVDALTFFSDMGLRIPQDISICGFDGNIFASQCRPRLTTVRQVVSDKAIHAVAQLFRMIKKEKLDQRLIRLGVSIIEGGSVQELKPRY
jgi:LacI family transcriptional regulator